MSKPRAYSDTTVSTQKSRADIDKLLTKWGVDGVQWTTLKGERSVVRFQIEHNGAPLMIRLAVDPPAMAPEEQPEWADEDWEPNPKKAAKEARRLHRMLFWYIKSLLEAVDAGILAVDQAFLSHIEGSKGKTVYEVVGEQLQAMVEGGSNRLALPAAKRKR